MVQLVKLLRGVLVLAAALLAACSGPPDAAVVRSAVQQQLDAALGPGLLTIEQFRRAGSQRLTAGAAGGDARLVYFNAQLKLTRDYDFTQWDAHNVATLANLLGAGPRGISGLKAGGNTASDLIGVYGSAVFAAADGKGWALQPSAPAPPSDGLDLAAASAKVAVVQPGPRESPLPTAAEAALDRLSSLIDGNPTSSTLPAARREAIVTAEIDAAYRAARARLARGADTLVLAGGPPGGAYAELALGLSDRAQRANVPFEQLASEGSVANLRALADGSVQFALVQNDVAHAAHAGSGRFAGAAQADLRAVASLFPEAVQLVVRADGPIRTLADLKGRRVDLGLPGSGTRANALTILAAHDMPLASLAASSGHSLDEAAKSLAAGSIDALFSTVHAPARALQQVAARTPLRWIEIPATDALRDDGLLPLTLPARTYARQLKPVPTLAATALMLTRADVEAGAVQRMLGLLFDDGGAAASDNATLAQVSRQTAREGVLIPWSAPAQAFLAAAPQRDKPAR